MRRLRDEKAGLETREDINSEKAGVETREDINIERAGVKKAEEKKKAGMKMLEGFSWEY